jgi:hypothetical protein
MVRPRLDTLHGVHRAVQSEGDHQRDSDGLSVGLIDSSSTPEDEMTPRR